MLFKHVLIYTRTQCPFVLYVAFVFSLFISIVRFEEAFIKPCCLAGYGIGTVYRVAIRALHAQEREVSEGIRCRTIEQSDDRDLIELNWPVVLVFTTS